MKYRIFRARTDRNLRSWNLAWLHSFWRWSWIHQQKNSNFIEISVKFSKTCTARNRRGAPQSAHLYSHRKNKSNELRKILLFSNIPVAWAFHVSSLPAPARQLKFPPVCKSPTSGASDTPQNRKNQNWSKTQRQMTFCETYVLPIASQSKASPSLHIATYRCIDVP